MNKPNLFIVGQSKSGTSALYYFLSQHPDIYMSKVKEPFYFCKDLIEESDIFHGRKVYFHYRDKEKYLALFKKADNEKILGESSTSYIYSKVAAQEIWQFNPNARIIIILREPVSFVYSLHNEHYRKALDNVSDFATAVELEKDRRTGRNIPPNCYCPSLFFFAERVKYHDQVNRYLKLFGTENTKVIIYEDFKENNEVICNNIIAFLGVDKTFCPVIDKKNVSGMPRSGKLNTFIMSSSIKKTLQSFLPYSAYTLLKPFGRKLLWKQEPPLPISESLRKKLMADYKPEVIKISELLGVDLMKKWSYDRIG